CGGCAPLSVERATFEACPVCLRRIDRTRSRVGHSRSASLPASSFRLPASSFQLPASSFQLPAPALCLRGLPLMSRLLITLAATMALASWAPASPTVKRVRSGDDLQAILNTAQPGDESRL